MKSQTCSIAIIGAIYSVANSAVDGFAVDSRLTTARFAASASPSVSASFPLSMASTSGDDSNIETPPNEFARPISTDKVLKTSGGKRRMNQAYKLDVTATQEECDALAERFGLVKLHNLSATLSIQRPPEEISDGSSHYYTNGLMAVQVTGDVESRITQTCVRTNEDFEVDIGFSLLNLVKPITAKQMDEADELILKELKRNNIKTPESAKDVMDLQQMLENLAGEDDAIVEDESIYSGLTGKLDVGELVAQMLWLNVDPYPKKPGTTPVSFSISG
uniref:Uncharacterized protein n=1 Tax=Craspedostauros australis TaxID=1486917 RepID=A0A6T6EYI4_9STRA|mmetsp:Transcript_1731/g.4778  ORF Transcript_1731/g.4778 Transcript_1731/m.4778 type:complete len:276 (+) Transcript_1731:68-895(+)|eukprot:CAMPEP_0198133718 /NCGR_PEP_ID=MMETSP1442-20131203/59711_1 /TAXON_ID= /ORGANISM="Craspedostauros australis, Strain CCMP3328" /LENGTH=275 /DNA_ID=CAMNT_0043794849 /DNA_START=6 /DNA_END=833 /DNA_ORIENTATION=-